MQVRAGGSLLRLAIMRVALHAGAGQGDGMGWWGTIRGAQACSAALLWMRGAPAVGPAPGAAALARAAIESVAVLAAARRNEAPQLLSLRTLAQANTLADAEDA